MLDDYLMGAKMGKLLRAIEVAARLAVSRAIVYRWAKEGWLRSVQMPGVVRFDEDDVEQFIADRKTPAAYRRRAA
jgi:excisionase family DNA binding protein